MENIKRLQTQDKKLGNILTSVTTTSNRKSVLTTIEGTAAILPPLQWVLKRCCHLLRPSLSGVKKYLGTGIMQKNNCDVTAREIKGTVMGAVNYLMALL